MPATIKSLRAILKEDLLSLPESNNKDTYELVIDSIEEKLGEEIQIDDIDRSPRLGASKNNGKSRPILKFVRYDTHCTIF